MLTYSNKSLNERRFIFTKSFFSRFALYVACWFLRPKSAFPLLDFTSENLYIFTWFSLSWWLYVFFSSKNIKLPSYSASPEIKICYFFFTLSNIVCTILLVIFFLQIQPFHFLLPISVLKTTDIFRSNSVLIKKSAFLLSLACILLSKNVIKKTAIDFTF